MLLKMVFVAFRIKYILLRLGYEQRELSHQIYIERSRPRRCFPVPEESARGRHTSRVMQNIHKRQTCKICINAKRFNLFGYIRINSFLKHWKKNANFEPVDREIRFIYQNIDVYILKIRGRRPKSVVRRQHTQYGVNFHPSA